VITDFQIANKPVPIGEGSVLQQPITETDHLILSYKDRVFSFEFAALNYRSPEKNRYKYKLEGFEKEWNEVDSARRFATYTHLDPGEYVFRVIGSNNDGLWNKEGASVRITVTPSWWETIWFRGSMLILVISFIFGGFYWRVSIAESQKRQLEIQVDERTNELRESVAKYQDLYDNAPDMFASVDAKTANILNCNQTLANALGYAKEEIIGRPVFDMYTPDSAEHAKTNVFPRFVKTGAIKGEELQLQRKDGSKIDVSLNVSAVRDEQGGIIYSRSVWRDITKRKKIKQLEADRTYLREEIKLEYDYDNIIGESEVLKYVLYNLERIAPTDTTVLILGETGTGKELIARAIHHGSKRKQRPLIKVDCAALPANLIGSELFGHEKGAFTGAVEKRIGRFELAGRATLFLDEIGELPVELQPKLLRILQEGEFERLGSSQVRHADVRVIAATNRDLEEDVRKGRFRKDLWYRLNVFPLSVPPLRDRVDDIPLLVNWMIKKIQRRLGKNIKTVPTDVLQNLMAYLWPGNVRELENVIEGAVIVTQGSKLQLTALLKVLESDDGASRDLPMKSLPEMEKDYILQALRKTNWNISGKYGAAKLLGLNSSTLRGRMRKHAIRRPAFKS